MKKIILIMLLALLPLGSAQAAYYLKVDDIEGESTTDAAATTRTDVNSDQTESTTNTGVEPDEIDNRVNDETTKGKVEMEWKVEEGENAMENSGIEPDEIDNKFRDEESFQGGINVASGDVTGDGLENTGIEPDEIDNKFDDDPQESNFAILLSSGDGEKGQERVAKVLEILKDGLDEEGVATEQISLNFEKITTRVKQTVKLFGLIPLTATATVEIDAKESVKVKFPWWTFFASGKDQDNLGQQIFQALSNVLKTKNDAVKNAINNIK